MNRSTWIGASEEVAEINHRNIVFLLPTAARALAQGHAHGNSSSPQVTGHVTKLAGSSEYLWTAMTQQSGCTIQELVDQVCRTFDVVDPQVVSQNVESWASSLAQIGLIRESAAGAIERLPSAPVPGAPMHGAPQDHPSEAALTQTEWALMAHALVHGLARSLEARAVSIKGPVLEHYNLRSPRVSSDADVWIDEAHRPVVEGALEERGWEQRRDRGENQARVLPDHSATFFHPNWPVDIDIHWWFPGIGVDGNTAFERIWEHRSSMKAAGVCIAIPSIVDAAVIQMLHCAKQTTSPGRVDELDGAVLRVKKWPVARRNELVDRLVELHACDPLQKIFADAGISHLERQWTPEERKRWTFAAETDQSGSTAAILFQLWNAPWKRKPKELWEALWPSNAELIATDMRHDSSKEHVRAIRYRRWVKGMRALPNAAKALTRIVTRKSLDGDSTQPGTASGTPYRDGSQ